VLFFVSRCITVHITINDSYESMHSGSHRAAIMLSTVRVVISNYSKLKNIENTSHDSIHCKMQGALNGKTMHVVYASFVFFSLESSTQLYNHYRTVEENSVKCVPSEGFFWHSDFTKFDSGRGSTPVPAGGAYDVPPDHLVGWGGDTPPHSPTPRRLRRLAHRASPL